jgi:hypothetical protein
MGTRPIARNKNYILEEVTSRLNSGKRLLELISEISSSRLIYKTLEANMQNSNFTSFSIVWM